MKRGANFTGTNEPTGKGWGYAGDGGCNSCKHSKMVLTLELELGKSCYGAGVIELELADRKDWTLELEERPKDSMFFERGRGGKRTGC